MGTTIILDNEICDIGQYHRTKFINELIIVDDKIDFLSEILKVDETDRYILVKNLSKMLADIHTSGLDRLLLRALISRDVIGLDHIRGKKGLHNIGPGIGNFGAKFLLIGERPGNKKPQFSDTDYPFFSTAGASRWLMDELEKANIDELDLYWINAFDRNGDKSDHHFINYMPNLAKIFALGNVAKDWCLSNQIPCVHIKHPQYWKRFKSQEPYPLITLLK